jgi:hypothetical protein
MSVRNGDLPGDGDGPVRAPVGRRRIVAVAAGLAVALGGGAYLVTAQLSDRDGSTEKREPGALAPMVSPMPSAPTTAVEQDGTGPAPIVSASPSAAPSTSAPAPVSASARSSATEKVSAELRKKIDAARATAAADGYPLQRAVGPTGDPVDPGAISTSTRNTAEGSIRITAAKANLAGQSTLLLAADEGRPAGAAHCTQKLRFSDAGARVMPTVLLCWRTSAKRSVITLATAKTGKPSTSASLAVLDREWVRLG